MAALLYIEVEMNYTYMVRCADGTLYTGWTNCLEKRLKAHNSGKNGAKYTKTKRPVTLVYYEGYQGRGYEPGVCHQAADPAAKAGADEVLMYHTGGVTCVAGIFSEPFQTRSKPACLQQSSTLR